MEWCQVSIDTANKGGNISIVLATGKENCNSEHTPLSTCGGTSVSKDTPSQICELEKETPNLPPIMDQNQEVKTSIFEFALTNRNEMYTKLISA